MGRDEHAGTLPDPVVFFFFHPPSLSFLRFPSTLVFVAPALGGGIRSLPSRKLDRSQKEKEKRMMIIAIIISEAGACVKPQTQVLYIAEILRNSER